MDENILGKYWAPMALFYAKVKEDVGNRMQWGHIRSQICGLANMKETDPSLQVLEIALRKFEYISESNIANLFHGHKWFFELVDEPSGGFRASQDELDEVQRILAEDAAKIERQAKETLARTDVEMRLSDKLDGVHEVVQSGTRAILDTVEESTRTVSGLVVVAGSMTTSSQDVLVNGRAISASSMMIVVKDGDHECGFRITDLATLNSIMATVYAGPSTRLY